MVIGCYDGSRADYKRAYRGVFASPFDYDLNMSSVRLARLKEISGRQPTEEQRKAILRLERFEELGGINERYLHPNEPITDEELESILKEAEPFKPQNLSQS